jgi:hypothetical protein
MRRRYTEDYATPIESRLPLGQRLARFLGLIGALFAITMAVLVTQRLSHDSLALLIGLSCGILAMLPTLALGVLIWRREETRRQEREQAPRQAYPTQPPVIVVTPQGLPNYGQQPAFGPAEPPNPWARPATERVFKIVGGND